MTPADPDTTPELKAARRVLLDALDALHDHRDSLVLIGAQAIYLRVGAGSFTVAPTTTDADLALDVDLLADDPNVVDALTNAGFVLDPTNQQPGAWLSQRGIPVDVMVPEHLAGPGGRRGARIPPHDNRAARRAAGLEASLVDQSPMKVDSLDGDGRSDIVNVAGPAADYVNLSWPCYPGLIWPHWRREVPRGADPGHDGAPSVMAALDVTLVAWTVPDGRTEACARQGGRRQVRPDALCDGPADSAPLGRVWF